MTLTRIDWAARLAEIDALVPRGIPDREDLCQDLALRIQAGTIHYLPSELLDAISRHFRERPALHRFGDVSLSVPLKEGSTSTLLDALSNKQL